MKRINALLLLSAVCISLLLGGAYGATVASATTPSPSPSFSAYRMYSSASLDDKCVDISFSFSEAAELQTFLTATASSGFLCVYVLEDVKLFASNGEDEIMLIALNKRHIEEQGVQCGESNIYLSPCTYYSNAQYDAKIPMEFFAGDSGHVEFFFEATYAWSEDVTGFPVEDGAAATITTEEKSNLKGISYNKSDGKISFSFTEKGEAE